MLLFRHYWLSSKTLLEEIFASPQEPVATRAFRSFIQSQVPQEETSDAF